MKVLVTGANGFVGRAVVTYLKNCGHEVIPAIRSGQRDQAIAVGDIDSSTDWSAALAGCTAVVHTAARVHRMQESGLQALAASREVNTAGTLNLARQAAGARVSRLVFLSSVKVHGEQGFFSVDDACQPLDAYAVSKREAELGLFEIAASTGMEVVILRLPLVYGEGVAANFLRLMRMVQRNVPLPFGAVNNRRSLVYLGNLVDAIQTCLISPRAANKIYLVSDGIDVSTGDLVRGMAVAFDRKARLLPIPPWLIRAAGALAGRSGEVERLVASLAVDSRPLREELGWTPPFTLQEGLSATARWYLESEKEAVV